MANTLLTLNVIAKEAMRILTANTIMAGLVNRNYENEYQKKGDTVNVPVPTTLKAIAFTGEIVKQDITESTIAVKLDKWRDISIDISSKDMTLNLDDFSARVIKPAMISIANQVDSDILATALESAGKTITESGTPVLGDIGNISKHFDIKKIPPQDRYFVMDPDHKYDFLNLDNLAKACYSGDSKALKDGEVGRIYALETFMDQNTPSSAATTAGTATSYSVTGTKGQSTVALSALSSATATVKIGEGFIFDGVLYRFTADGTGASSSITSIAIDQPLHKNIVSTDSVTLVTTKHSIAFWKDALAFVNRPLEIPASEKNNCVVENYNGLSIRVLYGYNQTTKSDCISFDILYGVKVLLSTGIVDFKK